MWFSGLGTSDEIDFHDSISLKTENNRENMRAIQQLY